MLNSVEAGRSAKDSPWDAEVERVDGAGAKRKRERGGDIKTARTVARYEKESSSDEPTGSFLSVLNVADPTAVPESVAFGSEPRHVARDGAPTAKQASALKVFRQMRWMSTRSETARRARGDTSGMCNAKPCVSVSGDPPPKAFPPRRCVAGIVFRRYVQGVDQDITCKQMRSDATEDLLETLST